MYVGSQPTAAVATKVGIKSSAGGTLALAIAMLETSDLLCNYPFGDNKVGDAANFGIYKMNWGMIKQCPSAAGSDAPHLGPALNNDPALATKILLEAMHIWMTNPPEPNHPIANNFWAGHRQGSTGLSNAVGANWDDIQDYYLAVQVIKAKCDGNATVWNSNIRYWLDVDPMRSAVRKTTFEG
jgi:hypothetical protein